MSVFVDTNILVYAHDETAAEKHLVANRLVRELWQLPVLPVISVQVCLELWRVLNWSAQLAREEIGNLVGSYLQWRVIPEDRELMAAALRLRREFGISIWDSCIVAAAQRGGVQQLWSVGMEPGKRFGAVTVVNPLVPDTG
ncbi:MAG: PIN domain-containing protein [Akkermansiaceae bacterium]|nr:PIN domain-containing protein [Akkermansiaceae bacterium]